MEVVEDTLYLQLHKLSATKSEEALDQLLSTLWKTRKTGLRQKSHFQSLLNLQSLSELDPVLACLRSLIRKWVHENFTADDLFKLFPPDLPLHLQSILVLLLQKYQSQWKEEIASEQQVKTTSVPPSLGISDSLHDHVAYLTRNEFGASTPTTASDFTPMSPHNLGSRLTMPFTERNRSSHPLLGTLSRLKSMTWTMENFNSGSANRVAVINLKLQQYTKSSLDEIEVKFQLTRDTLEAMLRSLTYIREQLSSMIGTASGPSQKKQKHSDNVI